MKATVKLYTSNLITKRGYPVVIVITHKMKIKRKTIAHSFLKDWNDKKEVPLETHMDFDKLYSKILNIRSKAYSLDFREITCIDEAFRFLLNESNNKRLDFYEYADKRIQFMIDQGRVGNADAYRFSIDALKKYKPKLFFDEITHVFLENFKLYKLSESKILKNGKIKRVSNSAIRTYLYEIRAIYNSCVRSYDVEDKMPFKGLFLDLKVKKRRKKNIYILKDGFKILKEYKSNYKSQNRTIDLTLLQFYFGGLDLVDLYYLKKSDINNGRVYLTRAKLGIKAEDFNVKLFDCAKKIMDKYNVTDSEYVFPWRKDRTGYKTFRSTHNKSLKKIIVDLNINVLPVPGPFTSKSVRHSFATIAKFEMVDVDIIRELMGHERNDIDTIYKDLYPEQMRDDAHSKIISLE